MELPSGAHDALDDLVRRWRRRRAAVGVVVGGRGDARERLRELSAKDIVKEAPAPAGEWVR